MPTKEKIMQLDSDCSGIIHGIFIGIHIVDDGVFDDDGYDSLDDSPSPLEDYVDTEFMHGDEDIHFYDNTPVARGDHEFRIVGGSYAPSGRYPYMVKGGGCGGSLIAPDMVLTAAHCAGAFNGELRIGSIERNSGGETARARFEIKHPQYKGSNYDFMVVKLDRSVQAKSVRLNGSTGSPFNGEKLTVIGFGRTSEGGSSSNRLKQVKVNAWGHKKCSKVYGSTIQKSTMLCAG